MKISISNRTINSTLVNGALEAWKIDDAFDVLEYIKSKHKVVLGGDILTDDLDYNCCNWYYEPDVTKTVRENIDCSCKKALDYIKDYIKRNGSEYYIVFVDSYLI